MNRPVLALLVSSALTLTSCAPSQPFVVNLAVGSLELVWGAEATVEVSVSGAGGAPVALTATGLPAGVSASFSPPELGGGESASAMTLSAGVQAAEGDAVVTVSAIAGDRSTSATLDLAVTSLTVNGTVVGVRGDGRPGVGVASGATVTSTAADGTFTLSGLSVPYDLVVYETGIDGYGHVFVGLTVASPVLLPIRAVNNPQYPSATIQGALPEPVPADSEAFVCVEGVEVAVTGCDRLAEGEAGFDFKAEWVGGGTVPVRVHVLVSSLDPGGFPQAFTALGSAEGSVTAGDQSTIDVDSYDPGPGSAAQMATVTAPAGFTNGALGVSVQRAPYASMRVAGAAMTLPDTALLQVPLTADERYDVFAQAFGPGNAVAFAWRSGLAVGDDASLTLPSSPVLVSPADGALGVTHATSFVVASNPDALNTFIFAPQVPAPLFTVTTMAESVTIPDLAALGLPLPPGIPYVWRVIQSGLPSVDDGSFGWYGQLSEVIDAVTLAGPPLGHDGWHSGSPSRAFTTE
jgi:hypothetical protein